MFSMEEFTLFWEQGFKLSEPTRLDMRGIIGLYAIEYDSRVVYIGKAETEGAIKEARSHGIYEKRLKEQRMQWDKNQALIYVGTVPQDQKSGLIDDAEKLLIFKLQPPCNKQRKKRYSGIKPFQVINEGNKPTELPRQIQIS
jgi:hypothetical protein